MQIYDDMSEKQLEDLVGELDKRIYAACGSLVDQRRFAQTHLDARRATSTTIYASATSNLDAVIRCLDLNDDFTMTKREMNNTIRAGGFRKKKPHTTEGAIRDSINEQLETATFIEIDGKVGRASAAPNAKKA